MKVHELIDLLKTMPQDANVTVYNAGDEPIAYTNLGVESVYENGSEVVIAEKGGGT